MPQVRFSFMTTIWKVTANSLINLKKSVSYRSNNWEYYRAHYCIELWMELIQVYSFPLTESERILKKMEIGKWKKFSKTTIGRDILSVRTVNIESNKIFRTLLTSSSFNEYEVTKSCHFSFPIQPNSEKKEIQVQCTDTERKRKNWRTHQKKQNTILDNKNLFTDKKNDIGLSRSVFSEEKK